MEKVLIAAGLTAAAVFVPGAMQGIAIGAMLTTALKVIGYVRTGSFQSAPTTWSPCAIAAGGVVEEVLYRGLLLGIVGQVASAVIFGLVHDTWESCFIAIGSALLVLNPTYLTFGLAGSISAHVTHNLLSTSLPCET